jgi:hypothetical protein
MMIVRYISRTLVPTACDAVTPRYAHSTEVRGLYIVQLRYVQIMMEFERTYPAKLGDKELCHRGWMQK